MSSSIVLGIFWHFIGATSAACFYAPLKKSLIGHGKLCGRLQGYFLGFYYLGRLAISYCLIFILTTRLLAVVY